MHSLSGRLPPLTALLVFEAAARHENFTHAADELGRTQSAVSRQVAALETALGVRLFRRATRTVHLTEAGRTLQSAVTMGLEHIARAVDDLRTVDDAGAETVTIASSPALTTFWLLPRLTEYSTVHPDADIRVVVVSEPLHDPDARDADLLFGWGDGAWPGLDSRLLSGDEMLAVRSPAYVPRGPIRCVDDLTKERLLHLDPPRSTRGPGAWQGWLDWAAWYRELGAAGAPNLSRGLHLNSFMHLMQACLGGEGIALAWRMAVQDHIKTGALVPVLDDRLAIDAGYYLAWPAGRPTTPEAARFRDWLLARAAAEAP